MRLNSWTLAYSNKGGNRIEERSRDVRLGPVISIRSRDFCHPYNSKHMSSGVNATVAPAIIYTTRIHVAGMLRLMGLRFV